MLYDFNTLVCGICTGESPRKSYFLPVDLSWNWTKGRIASAQSVQIGTQQQCGPTAAQAMSTTDHTVFIEFMLTTVQQALDNTICSEAVYCVQYRIFCLGCAARRQKQLESHELGHRAPWSFNRRPENKHIHHDASNSV